MNISGYIRQDVLNKLLSNNGTVENVSQIINEINKSESISALKHINTNLLINRKDEINEISSFFEDETQRLLLVGGIQGAGKSTIIRTTIANCQEHVLIYWYECSKVTNLDDILLSLCAFFDKKVGKSKFPPKQKTVISIDERLISYLKTLEREMILVLDSIEYLVSPEFTIKDDELKQFFNYLLSHPKVKVVLIGQRLPTGDMEYVEDFITEIRLAGLNEQYAINLMRGNGLNASNSSLYELYKYSRGYPWGILLTASIAKRLKIKPEKIIHDLASYEDSYESFLIKSIYGELNDIERSLLDYLSVIRHPINIPTFCNLDKLFQDPEHFLDELLKIKLVRTTGKRYHVNATVRKYVYNFVPFEEKYALHLTISKFYANEMSKNLADRTIRLSRNLLRSEQFYHNSTATKFYTSKDQFEQKNKYVDTLQQKTSKDDRHVQENINNKTMQQRLLQGFEMLNAEKTNDSDDVSAMDLDTSFQLQLPGQHQTPSKEIINIDGYQIELTEEEKELLKEAEKEIQSEKIVKNKTFNITENIVEYIDTEQESIANIEENVSELSNIDDLSLEFDIDTSDEESIQSNIDLVESLVFVAQGYANENKHNIAIERYKEALDICEKSNILNNTAKTLMLMAESYLSLKQYKLSLDCYEKCNKIFNEIKDFSMIPILLTSIAKVYSECYQHEKALSHYIEVLKLPEEQLTNQVKARAYLGIGEIYDYRHQFNDSLKYYIESLKAFKEINDISNLAMIYSRIALIYDDLGEFEKAIENYELSLRLDKQLGRKEMYAATLSNLAAVCDEIGQRSRSLKYYKQSLVIDKELNNLEGLYKTFSRIGTIYSEINRTDKALIYYKQELKIAKTVKDPYWIAMAYLDLGDLHYFMNDFVRAAKYFFISQKVISKSISTDSREKIERRIRTLLDHIPKEKLDEIKQQVLNK